MSQVKPKIYVNIQPTKEEAARIEREENTWTGPRLVALAAATLGTAFVALYLMAQVTSETHWDDWLLPW